MTEYADLSQKDKLSKPLNISLVSTTYPPVPGGMEVYVEKVARALRIAGNDVRVATRFATRRPEDGMRGLLTSAAPGLRRRDQGVRIRELRPGWRGALLQPVFRLQARSYTRSIAKYLFNKAYFADLYEATKGSEVVHYSGTGREMLGFTALKLAQQRGVPLVVTPHTHVESWGDGDVDIALYRQADAVIALTAFERSHLSSLGVDAARIYVVGHGVTVQGTGNAVRAREQLNFDGPVVLFLGRKTHYKGFGDVLASAPEIWNTYPETCFVFAGPDADDTGGLRTKHDDVLKDARVVERGFVSEQEKEDLLAAADVFCLPSRAEAYGLVYLEAWVYETPVVARAIPTLRELIGGSGGGLLVDEDGGTIAEALVRLLENKELRTKLGAAGKAHADQQTWTRVAKQLTSIYTQHRQGAP